DLLLILMLFFFTTTSTTELYTLSLHDALPICSRPGNNTRIWRNQMDANPIKIGLVAELTGPLSFMGIANANISTMQDSGPVSSRSEEHTSELQSQSNLVCRLLLEKKKKIKKKT